MPLLSIISIMAWLLLLIRLDPRTAGRMGTVKFWIISTLVALASGLAFGKPDYLFLGINISRTGIEAGLLMSARAIFIFSLFSFLSIRIGLDNFRKAAAYAGLEQLGTAAAAAFSILPFLKQSIEAHHGSRKKVKGKVKKKKRYQLGLIVEEMAGLLFDTASLAEALAGKHDVKPKIIALVADPGEGKTTILEQVAADLKIHGLSIGGIVQPRIESTGPAAQGYLVKDVSNDETCELAKSKPSPGILELGFDFSEHAWSWARKKIENARLFCDILVIDELGLLEAQGGGHMPALTVKLPLDRARIWIAAVRSDCKKEIEKQIGPFNMELPIPPKNGSIDFLDMIRRTIERDPLE